MANTTVKARGDNSELAVLLETTLNAIPTTGTLYEIRKPSESLTGTQATKYDGDITEDGQHGSTIRGVKEYKGSMEMQLSSGMLNNFLPALCGRDDWTTETVALAGAITVASSIGTFTSTGTPDLSKIVVGSVMTITSSASNNDKWLIISKDIGAYTITFRAYRVGQSIPVAESGMTATLTNIFVHSGGKNYNKSWTTQRRVGVPGKTSTFVKFTGRRPDSISMKSGAGDAPTASLGMIGLGRTIANDGLLAPAGQTLFGDAGGAGNLTAGETLCVVTTAGTINFAIGQTFSFVDDPIFRDVVSVAADPKKAFSFSPAIETGTTITAGAAIYCGAAASVEGVAQKFEDNLGFIMIDGGTGIPESSSTVDFTNNSAHDHKTGQADPDSNEVGERSCTGTIETSVNADEIDLLAKIQAGTTFQRIFVANDRAGLSLGYVIHTCDGEDNTGPAIAGPGVMKYTVNFKALKNATYNSYLTFFRA